MRRPDRDDYALCECRQAQEEGHSICAGCEEYDAAMRVWLDTYPWQVDEPERPGEER
jgi:hypothetical protein